MMLTCPATMCSCLLLESLIWTVTTGGYVHRGTALPTQF